jgi:hypothetical protein
MQVEGFDFADPLYSSVVAMSTVGGGVERSCRLLARQWLD